jgi:hypothetical protein
MTYPPVIQFETRALDAEARARLAWERRAARAPKQPTHRWRQFMTGLRLPWSEACRRARVYEEEHRLIECER